MAISSESASRDEVLWEVVTRAGTHAEAPHPEEIDLAALLGDAARERRFPGDADMEKLERKATIARKIFARYRLDWTADRSGRMASMETLAGTAALMLLDAASAQDRSRALKRLNGALWILELPDWKADAPGAREVAGEAERMAREIAGSAP